MKTLPLPVTPESFLDVHLEILNCLLRLTKQERVLLRLLIESHQSKDPQPEFLGNQHRATLAQEMELSESGVANYIKSLTDKKALLRKRHVYSLNPLVLPEQDGISFPFVWNTPT